MTIDYYSKNQKKVGFLRQKDISDRDGVRDQSESIRNQSEPKTTNNSYKYGNL